MKMTAKSTIGRAVLRAKRKDRDGLNWLIRQFKKGKLSKESVINHLLNAYMNGIRI